MAQQKPVEMDLKVGTALTANSKQHDGWMYCVQVFLKSDCGDERENSEPSQFHVLDFERGKSGTFIIVTNRTPEHQTVGNFAT